MRYGPREIKRFGGSYGVLWQQLESMEWQRPSCLPRRLIQYAAVKKTTTTTVDVEKNESIESEDEESSIFRHLNVECFFESLEQC